MTKATAFLALLLLVGLLLVVISLPVVAALQWSRFIGTGRPPRFLDFPARPFFGIAWRLVIFGALFRVPGQIEPWLKVHFQGAPSWAVSGLADLAGLAILVLASPWAMVIPALALRGARPSTLALATAARRSRSFYLGALIVLAPLTVVSWAMQFQTRDDGALTWVLWTAWSLALFGTFIVAMTYLTRVYLRLEPSVRPAG